MEPSSDFDQIPQPRIVSALSTNALAPITKSREISKLSAIELLVRRFTPAERLLLYIFTFLLSVATLSLVIQVNRAVSVAVPAPGGSLSEGETSPARFINPILAISQSDQDLTAITFSGLMRVTPDGSLIPDLASSYAISADGTTYTFTLRPGLTFHDGKPVTADDIVYTVELAQNPDIKSPRRADWEGVTVSSTDERTIVFTLPHAYAPFIEDTTLGILPKHLWEKVDTDDFPFSTLNTHPIGTGPYKIKDNQTDSTGATTRYNLEPFAGYALGAPLLSRISFIFYPNEDALIKAYNTKELDTVTGLTSEQLSSITRKDGSIIAAPLPRVFGIFFNQNHNKALTDLAARRALDAAIDKEAIVRNVLGGFGSQIDGPVPPGVTGNRSATTPSPVSGAQFVIASTTADATKIEDARAILKKGGWSIGATSTAWTKSKLPPLTLKLATTDAPELVATANMIADAWKALGVHVTVQVYPLSEFNNTILRPREYDAVLFGEVVGREADLFAFWHSTQRNDPGLNLALYTNAKADTVLTEARATTNRSERDNLYDEFASLVKEDSPAVFLYAPEFLYLLPSQLKDVKIGALTTPAERFLNVYEWHTSIEYVWSFFTDKTNP